MFPKPTGKHKVYHANKPDFAKKEPYAGIPLEVRQEVYARSNGFCEGVVHRIRDGKKYSFDRILICPESATDMAHIEPKKMGGSRELDSASNLLHLCRKCHDLFDDRSR